MSSSKGQVIKRSNRGLLPPLMLLNTTPLTPPSKAFVSVVVCQIKEGDQVEGCDPSLQDMKQIRRLPLVIPPSLGRQGGGQRLRISFRRRCCRYVVLPLQSIKQRSKNKVSACRNYFVKRKEKGLGRGARLWYLRSFSLVALTTKSEK